MLRTVLIAAGVAWAGYLFIRHVIKEQRHRKQAKEWGCEPPPRERGTWYGILVIKEFIQSMRDERATQYFIQWNERNPKTYVTTVFDIDIIQTYEPANIQALLATQFEDFNLGYRLQSWSPMFGKGIFTTDGAEWFVHPLVSSVEAQLISRPGNTSEQFSGHNSPESCYKISTPRKSTIVIYSGTSRSAQMGGPIESTSNRSSLA
jgi:hypothetical protein